MPLIVRGPGIPAGLPREHLVLNSDFAPTFAELAGTPAADFVDGRSLVPPLRATLLCAESWQREFRGVFPRAGICSRTPYTTALSTTPTSQTGSTASM